MVRSSEAKPHNPGVGEGHCFLEENPVFCPAHLLVQLPARQTQCDDPVVGQLLGGNLWGQGNGRGWTRSLDSPGPCQAKGAQGAQEPILQGCVA